MTALQGRWPPKGLGQGFSGVSLPGDSPLFLQMWKASAGHAVSITQDDGEADDWETDPDFVVGVASLLCLTRCLPLKFPGWACAELVNFLQATEYTR